MTDNFIEITLIKPEGFLMVAETLTRIGVPNKSKTELYQTAHILHKQGRYFLVHFKQMFELDGKYSNFDKEDQVRLNTIADLLRQWKLITILNEEKFSEKMKLGTNLKVISSSDKKNWTLTPKYTIGKKD